MAIMGISAISVTLSVIVLNMRHGGERSRPVPPWLSYVTYRILGNVIFWHSDTRALESQNRSHVSFQQAFTSLSEQLAYPTTNGNQQTCSLTLSPPKLGETSTPIIHTFLKKGIRKPMARPEINRSLNIDKTEPASASNAEILRYSNKDAA